MARTKRVYYAQAVYHVIARGNNRQFIFQAQEDKEMFVQTLTKYQARSNLDIYSFVIMDNHFHLLLRVSEKENISRLMQRILLSFSQKYRRKYEYVGHVWQGRFVSKLVVDENQFRENLTYIHNNPVRAKLVEAASLYNWSSAVMYENDSVEMSFRGLRIKKFG